MRYSNRIRPLKTSNVLLRYLRLTSVTRLDSGNAWFSRSRIRHENAKKRGSGQIQSGTILSRVFSEEPTAQDVAEIRDEVRRVLNVVLAGEDELRRIVCLMLEGLDNKEIANELQCTVRTVQRKFELICKLWEQDAEPRIQSLPN